VNDPGRRSMKKGLKQRRDEGKSLEKGMRLARAHASRIPN